MSVKSFVFDVGEKLFFIEIYITFSAKKIHMPILISSATISKDLSNICGLEGRSLIQPSMYRGGISTTISQLVQTQGITPYISHHHQ